MTYFQFLLAFVVPPIVLLGATQPRPLAGVGGLRSGVSLPLICLIAFLYTTPWDNYLVYRGVWTYGADRVVAVLGYVPLEEYAFFLLQPLLTGLFLYRLLGRRPRPQPSPARAPYLLGALGYLALAVTGFILLGTRWPHGLYLGLILAWAGPVLLGMWLYAGRHFWQHRHTFSIGITIPTAYLWIIDRLAIGLGIWDIADAYSLNFDLLGLPVEEAVFFLVTNLLVVQGLLLFLHGDHVYRGMQPVSGPGP